RAQSRSDKRVEEQILEAMSHAQRFDLYWTDLVWRIATARNARAPAAGSPGAPPHPLQRALDETPAARWTLSCRHSNRSTRHASSIARRIQPRARAASVS